MKFISGTALALVLASAGCADHPDDAGARHAAASSPGASGVQLAQQNCRRELPVGSNIPVTRCDPSDGGAAFRQMRDDLPRTGAAPVTAQQFGNTGH